jgi:hypothetical protein
MVRLTVTVPRFTGPAAFAVKLVLGLSDIGSLLASGRVGDLVKDDMLEPFDVERELDTGVGGDPSAGPIELMNDGGMMRLPVPGIWRGVLGRFAERTETLTFHGKATVRGGGTPTPGARVETPLPLCAGLRRLEMGIAPCRSRLGAPSASAEPPGRPLRCAPGGPPARLAPPGLGRAATAAARRPPVGLVRRSRASSCT